LLPIPSALFAQSFIDSVAPLRRRLALLGHLDGILNYCRTKVPLGVVEAINGNIKSLLRRGRGYKNLRYLLLKAQRMAATGRAPDRPRSPQRWPSGCTCR